MDFTALLLELIKPEFIVVAVVCFFFGMFLKKLPSVPDWVIPFAVLVFGIVLAIVYQIFVLEPEMTAKSIMLGFIQGFLCAAAAVFISQAKIQATVKRNLDTYNIVNKENAVGFNYNLNKQIKLHVKKPPEESKIEITD